MQHLIFDSHPLKSSAKVYRSHQGHLRLDCVATCAGVLRYYDSVGNPMDVLRHPDQIFDSNSVATLSGLPITISHPVENNQYCLVTPQNWKKYAVGVMGDSIDVVNPYVKVNGCSIQDNEALELLQAGSKQLSPGYQGVIVAEKGVFDGKSYTHRQYPIDQNGVIAYNHVALMDHFEKGRNGDNAVFLVDSDQIPVLFMDSDQDPEKSSHLIKTPWKNPKRATMKTVIFDAKDPQNPNKTLLSAGYQVDDNGMVMIPQSDYQTIVDLNSMQYSLLMNSYNTLSSLGMESLSTLADSYKETKAALETAQKELEKTPVVDSDKKFTIDEVREYSKLISDVSRHVDNVDFYQLDSTGIKKELLKFYDEELQLDSMDEPSINGAYAIAIKALDKRFGNAKRQADLVADSVEKASKTGGSTIVDMDTIQNNLRNSRRRKA